MISPVTQVYAVLLRTEYFLEGRALLHIKFCPYNQQLIVMVKFWMTLMILQFSLNWHLCKAFTSSQRKPHTKNMKQRHVFGWARGDEDSFCSSRHSAASLESVPHLRTKATDTIRPCLGTRPEPSIVWLSSPEWHASSLLQKAEKGVEGGWKQKTNQCNQSSLVTKNRMGTAIVLCHPDLHAASCGHRGPLKDVCDSTLETTFSSGLTMAETHILLTASVARQGSNLNG